MILLLIYDAFRSRLLLITLIFI